MEWEKPMVNVKKVRLGTNERMSFSTINEILEMPNLIEIQKSSYKWFVEQGLREVLFEMPPICDYTNNLELTFVDYRLEDTPKYSIIECKERDATYAAALRVTARLLNRETGEIKESEVSMGDFPIMTESGTFVINGAERAIVSQLVRSPSVYYGMTHDKTGKELYTTTVIPNRGAWLEYETDQNDLFYVRIDKNRKLPITTFIRALGVSTNEQIREMFGDELWISKTIEKDATNNTDDALIEVYKKLRPGEPPLVESAHTLLSNYFFDPKRYDLAKVGRYKFNKKLAFRNRINKHIIAADVVDPATGEVIAEAGEKIYFKHDDGKYYNRFHFVTPEGEITTYDKKHLFHN